MRIRACVRVCVGAGEVIKETPVPSMGYTSIGESRKQYCRGAVSILGSETISYANTQHGLIEILDDIILHLQSYRKIVGSINLTA